MTAPALSRTCQTDADCLTILAAVRLEPDAVLRRMQHARECSKAESADDGRGVATANASVFCQNPRTRKGLPCGRSRLLTAVFAALVAGLAGCAGAPREDESPTGADAGPRSSIAPTSSEELRILGTHVSPTISAEFTADGKWIVVAGTDGVTIHDAVSARCVNWLNGHLAEVSPSGASFLLEHPNGSPELRSIPEGRLLWRLPDGVATKEMHFSDDGQYIACGYQDLLRVETHEVVHRSPRTCYFDRINGGDHDHDPAGRPQHDANPEDESAARLSVLPYIYRATLRHDARPLITPKSGLCSPSGQFLIVQTGEEDSSLEPYYSFINRKTSEQLFSDVPSSNPLFFHNDAYVFYGETVYGTKNKDIRYTLPQGITAVALNSDETLLAAGWRNGKVALLDPTSGKEIFSATVETHIDTRSQKCGDLVALAFSPDSTVLAVVGRKLTIIEIASQTISGVLDLGPGSREVAAPETTSPATIAFNADGSRLLLTARQGDEYIYSRPKALVLNSADLRQRRHLCSSDYFDRVLNTLPVFFTPDGAYAIAAHDGRGTRRGQLQLWDTEASRPLADISAAFDWNYRRGFVVSNFPKRQLGLGHVGSWYEDQLILYPWSLDSNRPSEGSELPERAKDWLQTFVQASPQNTSWYVNGATLAFPAKRWLLRFDNNRIQRLYDLSTGSIYPSDYRPLTAQQARELDAVDVPKKCWGLASVEGIAFSPDGSRLLVYCRWRKGQSQDLLALYAMPSGSLIRSYQGHAHIGRIHIAPNNRIAAISTNFYNKTWIVDLETGATLVELPKGGKCVFSPDSRHAQVGDRYGESRSLLTIDTGDQIDFKWADRWSFSPNSRYAVGGGRRSWFFLDLASGDKTEISGEIHQTGVQILSTTKSDFPHAGSRFLCVDKGKTSLFDVNAAKSLATFDPVEIARESASGSDKTPSDYDPTAVFRYQYTPNDQEFVYVTEGWRVKEDSSGDESRRVAKSAATEHSTQVLIGDLETGRQIRSSAPCWSRSPLQHKLFTRDGTHLVTISADKMACWRLHPLELAWETRLSDRWTDPETGLPFAADDTLRWSLGYATDPSDRSILIAADGREAIMFSLATGKEEQRFGPLPINSVLRFGAGGAYLHAGYRASRSMRLYDTSSGELIRTYHFTNEGTELHRVDSAGAH